MRTHEGIAHHALVIWGKCHQLRLPDEDGSEKQARRRRLEFIKSHLVRERDAMIEAFSKYQKGPKGKPHLTPASADRVRRIREAFKAQIEHEKSCGYEPGTGRPDFYPRPSAQTGTPDKYPKGAFQNANRLDSVQAVTFQIVEDYLAKRPMQRALAWRVFVESKSVMGFRYSEGEHQICGSKSAADRLMKSLKIRIEAIFIESFIPRPTTEESLRIA